MLRSILGVALAAGLCASLSASAATIEVTTMQDQAPPSECELDEAILNANQDEENFGCDGGDGADVITFDIETDGGTLTLDGPLPVITEGVTIRGRGAGRTTIDGDQLFRPFTVADGVRLTLESITVRGGAAPAGNGGAILLGIDSTGNLRDCRISASEAANGGGIYALESILKIERCLIDGNVAAAQGGGLHSRGATIEIVNTTFSGNGADAGGGLAVVDAGDPGTTSLYSVTLSDNGADTGAGVLVGGDSELQAQHAIFARPTAGENCDGPVTSLDWNLADDGSCGLGEAHDQDDVGAGLAGLADNGGPTGTHRLQDGSNAIDAGDVYCRDGAGVELATDQRGAGFPRRTDGDGEPGFHCDLGAYEAAPEPGAAAGAAAAALATLARRRRHRVP